jgi:hypothetical protein
VATDLKIIVEAASTSETWENFYQTTRRNSPEGCHLHNRRRDNLKSHITKSLDGEDNFAETCGLSKAACCDIVVCRCYMTAIAVTSPVLQEAACVSVLANIVNTIATNVKISTPMDYARFPHAFFVILCTMHDLH